MLNHLKSKSTALARAAVSHRAVYGFLALCYGAGSIVIGHPELYGPLALGHLILAVRG